MNLYLFPEVISDFDGYGIAVKQGYQKLNPKEEDLVIWYTKKKDIPFLKKNDIVIDKSKITLKKRLLNVLKCSPSTQLNYNDLKFLKKYEFNEIHCDEILFFKALRQIYPEKHITVRLHNNFSRIYTRYKMLNNIKIDWKFKLILFLCRNVEKYIMNDKNSHKIFLTEEDKDYYTQTFGIKTDSEVWSFPLDSKKIIDARQENPILKKKLIWFGGIDPHKESSVYWFIKKVYIPLKKEIPELEFHLWGRGTKIFSDSSKNIFGHGFYDGHDFPDKEGLYINPDLLGGGIKLKVLSYLNEGQPFISTQFGFEGYSEDLIDEKFCIVKDASEWNDTIYNYFNNYSC